MYTKLPSFAEKLQRSDTYCKTAYKGGFLHGEVQPKGNGIDTEGVLFSQGFNATKV